MGAETIWNKPMADPITPEVSTRICQHMNEDHGSAVLVYAQVYGQLQGVEQAQMLAIDPQGMEIAAVVAGATQKIRIPFERDLTDSEDAHQMLIKMVREARSQSPA
jgi:putative heme iron utilization protein